MPLRLIAVPLRCPNKQLCNFETVAIFLWPANLPYVGCLLRLGAQSVPLLLAGSDSCPAARLLSWLAFWESPSGATGAGAGAGAAAAAESAWCFGSGGSGAGVSHCSCLPATQKGLVSPTPQDQNK